MVAASVAFGATIEDQNDATALAMNLDGDTIKGALATSTWTPDPNAGAIGYANLTNEVTDSTGDYAAGGPTLGTQTWATASGAVTFSSANITRTGCTITGIRQLFLYDSTKSRALTNTDFGSDTNVSAGALQVTAPAAGWFYFDITP